MWKSLKIPYSARKKASTQLVEKKWQKGMVFPPVSFSTGTVFLLNGKCGKRKYTNCIKTVQADPFNAGC